MTRIFDALRKAQVEQGTPLPPAHPAPALAPVPPALFHAGNMNNQRHPQQRVAQAEFAQLAVAAPEFAMVGVKNHDGVIH